MNNSKKEPCHRNPIGGSDAFRQKTRFFTGWQYRL